MEPIRWQETSLSLLDQRKLPTQVIWTDYTDYRDIIAAIKTLEVRGAPSIGVSAAYAYCLAALEFQHLPQADFAAKMAQAKEELAASRPTAVNLFWALDRMSRCLAAHNAAPDCVGALIAEAKQLDAENLEMNRKMSEFGAHVVPQGARILTHCNAGPIATGEKTIADVGAELFHLILDVASGVKKPYSDQYGFHNDLCIFNPAPIT